MDSNKQKHEEQTNNEYKFVKETIIDKKAVLRKELLRLVTNFFLIITVCIITCVIFIRLTKDSREDGTDIVTSDSLTSSSENMNSESGESTDGLTPEEINKLKYINGIVSFTGLVKGETEEEKTLRDEKTGELINENTRKFIGAIISKEPQLIAITSAENVENIGTIYADFMGKTGVEVKVSYIDKDLNIAYLALKRSVISYTELEEITLFNIAKNDEPAVGKEIKCCVMIKGVGLSVIDGTVISKGEEEIVVDTVLKKYLIDVGISGISEGFIFDNDGNLIAIVDIDNIENHNIKVLDISSIKTRVSSAAIRESVINLGVKGQKVTAQIEDLVGKDLPDGLYVTHVEVDSPAYKAGIMVGDIIYRVNTYSVDELNDIRYVIDSLKSGDEISVFLYRNMGTKYNTYKLPVVLGVKK